MVSFLASGLVLIGAYILVIALIEVRHLMAELPTGKIRQRWLVLRTMIAAFIFGYIIYAFDFWGQHTAWHDLIVPLVFFLGAGFVWLSVVISFQTATDIRRVTMLEYENITDPLTGIYNRRYLDRRLDEECARSLRYQSPLSILLIDIDYFKKINDTYGHQAGDSALCNASKLIQQVIRESDILARYGGDEFLIIAPNTSQSEAVTLANRIRRQFEDHILALPEDFDPTKKIYTTVTIGVAGLGKSANNRQGLLLNADKALYFGKKEGRNYVARYKANMQ